MKNRKCWPYRNKMERDYSRLLDTRKAAGEVANYRYEAVKFLVANPQQGKQAFWTPDFYVVLSDGSIEIHEVKGHMREAAMVRIKCVSEWCGVPVKVIYKRNGEWKVESV